MELEQPPEGTLCTLCFLPFSPESWDTRHTGADGRSDVHEACCYDNGLCADTDPDDEDVAPGPPGLQTYITTNSGISTATITLSDALVAARREQVAADPSEPAPF